MRSVFSLMVVLFSVASAHANPQVVFDCKGELAIDATETELVGITVQFDGAEYRSVLIGSLDTSAQPTSFVREPIAAARNRFGVSQILRVSGLSLAELATIQDVKIYTVGNFDDAAAGARAAEFLDGSGNPVTRGISFGAQGAIRCQ